DLTDYAQRLARSVGGGDVARELFVGEVGIVLILAGRLDDVDPLRAVAFGELGAPDRRLERRREIDVLEPALDEIAGVAGPNEIADLECGLRAMVENLSGRDVGCIHSKSPLDPVPLYGGHMGFAH